MSSPTTTTTTSFPSEGENKKKIYKNRAELNEYVTNMSCPSGTLWHGPARLLYIGSSSSGCCVICCCCWATFSTRTRRDCAVKNICCQQDLYYFATKKKSAIINIRTAMPGSDRRGGELAVSIFLRSTSFDAGGGQKNGEIRHGWPAQVVQLRLVTGQLIGWTWWYDESKWIRTNKQTHHLKRWPSYREMCRQGSPLPVARRIAGQSHYQCFTTCYIHYNRAAGPFFSSTQKWILMEPKADKRLLLIIQEVGRLAGPSRKRAKTRKNRPPIHLNKPIIC